MFRLIRCGIVAALAMAALVIPEAPAQTVSAREQIWSAMQRAEEPSRSRSSCPRRRREIEQALDLARQHLGPEDRTSAAVMNKLANLYADMGRYAEAEPLYHRSLAIFEQQLGPDHPDVAAQPEQPRAPVPGHGPIRRGRAALPPQPGDRGEAAVRAATTPHVAASLNNLARPVQVHGSGYGEAEPLYRRSLAIREQRLGAITPTWPPSLNGLAEPVPAHGPVRRGRAALQTQPGDQGEAAGARPPPRGRQPEQPGGPVPMPWAGTPRRSRSTNAAWRSLKSSWARPPLRRHLAEQPGGMLYSDLRPVCAGRSLCTCAG